MTLCGGILVALWLLALTVTDLREHPAARQCVTLPGGGPLTVAAVHGRGLPALAGATPALAPAAIC